MTSLYVELETYSRWEGASLRKIRVVGDTEMDALKILVRHIGIYLTEEGIDEQFEDAKELNNPIPTFEDFIEQIEECNGDGCDFIFFFKNETTGEVYIDDGSSEVEYYTV